MDAAFDGPDDDDDDDRGNNEQRGLLSRNRTREGDGQGPGQGQGQGQIRLESRQHVPGEYDFERDYVSSPSACACMLHRCCFACRVGFQLMLHL